jgi:hypothetical protein
VTEDELEEIDLSVTHAILMLYDLGANRAQAKRALRERIEIMCDILDEFEDVSCIDCFPYWPQPTPQKLH